jgi:hypothetical protein
VQTAVELRGRFTLFAWTERDIYTSTEFLPTAFLAVRSAEATRKCADDAMHLRINTGERSPELRKNFGTHQHREKAFKHLSGKKNPYFIIIGIEMRACYT